MTKKGRFEQSLFTRISGFRGGEATLGVTVSCPRIDNAITTPELKLGRLKAHRAGFF